MAWLIKKITEEVRDLDFNDEVHYKGCDYVYVVIHGRKYLRDEADCLFKQCNTIVDGIGIGLYRNINVATKINAIAWCCSSIKITQPLYCAAFIMSVHSGVDITQVRPEIFIIERPDDIALLRKKAQQYYNVAKVIICSSFINDVIRQVHLDKLYWLFPDIAIIAVPKYKLFIIRNEEALVGDFNAYLPNLIDAGYIYGRCSFNYKGSIIYEGKICDVDVAVTNALFNYDLPVKLAKNANF
jgi:hypothetical protein